MKTALTIGFFDGVHMGHQVLLRALREKNKHVTILTFSNHPQTIFNPPAPPLLLELSEKVALLEEYADTLIVRPFTPEFAATPFDVLLSQFDLSHLVLGAGSVFGKNREGNETNVRRYAAEQGFSVEYIEKVVFEGEPISSSRIRKALAEGNQHLANFLLHHNPAKV